jgi:hypothetical protein
MEATESELGEGDVAKPFAIHESIQNLEIGRVPLILILPTYYFFVTLFFSSETRIECYF